MKLILEKIKYFLDKILNILKSLLTSFFGGLSNIFTNDKPSKELKSVKIDNDNIDLEKEINSSSDSSYHNESPDSIILNKDSSFSVTLEIIEKIIQKNFCEELEIEEKDLTKNEKEYIKSLKEIIIPIINKDIENKYITNEFKLDDEIKKLVKAELEKQYKLEQTNKIHKENAIIMPLLIERKKPLIKQNTNNKPTFLENKAKELNIDNLIIENTSISSDKNAKSAPKIDELINNSIETKTINEYILHSEQNNQDEIDVLDILDASATIKFPPIDTPIQDNTLSYVQEGNNDLENNVEVLDDTSILEDNLKPNNNLNDSSVHIEIMEEELKELEPLKEEKNIPKQVEFENYDFRNLDNYIVKVDHTYNEELKKEELEDKNYDLLENLIQDLLEKIAKLKLKNLTPTAKEKLNLRERKIIELKNNLNLQKQKDISIEESILDEAILNDDLNALELELQKLHIDDKLNLQEYMLNSIEELDTINQDKAKSIEIELLKLRLNKTLHALEIPSLLALPFIHNKYFLYFTCGLLANRHLKLFDSILKRKTLEDELEDLSHIKSGAYA